MPSTPLVPPSDSTRPAELTVACRNFSMEKKDGGFLDSKDHYFDRLLRTMIMINSSPGLGYSIPFPNGHSCL